MSPPVRRWGEEFTHLARYYRGSAEYLDATVPFIREGLAAGEPVALAVPGPNLRLILTELGPDAERVRLLDMTRAGRNPGRIIPNVLRTFADSHPGGRVRMIAEHPWAGRVSREYPACSHQEPLINLALAGRPATLLCPYDVERAGPATRAAAETTHPLLMDASGRRASARYIPPRLPSDSLAPGPPATAASFNFDATNQVLVAQFATDHATRLGMGGDHAELKLIVSELAAHSTAHGAGHGTLRIWTEGAHLVCEVRHSGQTGERLSGRPGLDPRRSDNRGILLVNYLSDLVLQHCGGQGTLIRVYVKLAADEAVNEPGEPVVPLPRTRPASPGSAPLPWQTYEALHAAERFGRYVPLEPTEAERLGAPGGERSPEQRPVEPVLEALTAVEALARVVDRWRARLVRLARTRGAPWNDIGQSLGVSKQAAHERYGRTRSRPPGPDFRGRIGPLPPVQGM